MLGGQGRSAISSLNKEDLDRWFTREILPLESVLTRYLSRNWRNAGEIPDLLQEVYMRVYEGAQRSIPISVRPFLFTVARNLMIDRVRHLSLVSIESVPDIEKLDVMDDVPSPEQNLLDHEELKCVRKVISSLPSRCREILVLRKLENIPQREVARRLGVTEEVVEYQVAKAMRLLASAGRRHRGNIVAGAKGFFVLKGRRAQ